MSEFVKVHSKVPVVLRTFEPVEGPFGLISHMEKDRVTLRPGNNNVSSAFMEEWMKANSDNHFVKDKFIERID